MFIGCRYTSPPNIEQHIEDSPGLGFVHVCFSRHMGTAAVGGDVFYSSSTGEESYVRPKIFDDFLLAFIPANQ